MSHNSVVPLCVSKKAYHRFPKDENIRKKWILSIKRDKYKLSKYARICDDHFSPTDFVLPLEYYLENPKRTLKKGAIPSKFKWTKPPNLLAEQRRTRYENRCLKYTIPSSESRITPSPPEAICEIEVPTSVVPDLYIANTEQVLQTKDSSTMTKTLNNSFCIEKFTSVLKNSELHFYSGFDNYEHFYLVFNILGPAVNHLQYYPSMTNVKISYLSPANEFLLTVVKLRRSMSNKELSFKFNISETLVSRIFITWINFLFCQFKEINMWVPFDTAKQYCNFKDRKCTSTVIIDCTEIKIDQPKNPVSQQLTYSTYKSCNTLKVLVGLSSTGCISFVSESYGGSISDRCLFEKCGLTDMLQKKSFNDVVLADRGFQIQDLLAIKDVSVNIPEFLKKKSGQLDPEQLTRSKNLSSNRIHIERIIGLGKTYNILNHLSNNLVPLGSRIVFVCFMLANFRNNIMDPR